MSHETLIILLRIAGAGQICMAVVFLLAVPSILNWKTTLDNMPRLHRQIHQVYSKYVVGTVATLGLFSLLFPEDIASGKGLGAGVALFTGCFWGVRLILQMVYDIKPHLRTGQHIAGYHILTVVFSMLTALYAWAATIGSQ